MNQGNRVLMGYRIACIVAIVGVFCPWASYSASSNFGSAGSMSLSGGSSFWGILTLLSAIAGGVLSLIGPISILKEKTKMGMSGIGGLIVIFSLIGMATASSRIAGAQNLSISGIDGLRASSSVGAGFGVYLTLLSGAACAVCGFINRWE